MHVCMTWRSCLRFGSLTSPIWPPWCVAFASLCLFAANNHFQLRFVLEIGGEWKDEDPDGAGQAFFNYMLKFLTAEEDRLRADEEDSMSEGDAESDTDEVEEDDGFGVIDLNVNLVGWWNQYVSHTLRIVLILTTSM